MSSTFLDLYNDIRITVFPEYDGNIAPNLIPAVRRYIQEALDDLARWIPLLQSRNCDVYTNATVYTDSRLAYLPAPSGVVVEVFGIGADGDPDTRTSFAQVSYARLIKEEERQRRYLGESCVPPAMPFSEENVCEPLVADAVPNYPAYPSSITLDLGSGTDFPTTVSSGFTQCDEVRKTSQECTLPLQKACYAIELGRIVVSRPIGMNELWKVRWRGRKTRWADLDEIPTGVGIMTAVDLYVRERMARLQDCQQATADRFDQEYRIHRSKVIRDYRELEIADHQHAK